MNKYEMSTINYKIFYINSMFKLHSPNFYNYSTIPLIKFIEKPYFLNRQFQSSNCITVH